MLSKIGIFETEYCNKDFTCFEDETMFLKEILRLD